MDLNKIKLGYEELNKGNHLKASQYFQELYDALIYPENIFDKNGTQNYISLCKGLAEVNLKSNKVKEALANYLFIYEKIDSGDFDTLACLGQIYKNIGDVKNSHFFLEKSHELDVELFKNRFGESIETIASRFENNDESIYIYIISKCNFNCCFCDRGQKSFKDNVKLETTLEEVKNIISSVSIDKISSISVGGNEPLTNRNIGEIFEFLNALNIPLKLFTSGSEKNKLKELLAFQNIKEVFLPLYSSKADIHDNIVGKKGAFNDLMEIKEILEDKNIKYSFGKLLIKSNFLDDGFIQKGEFFNAIQPKDDKLYFENSISLTDMISKTDFQTDFKIDDYDILTKNTIPLCLVYDKIKDNKELIEKIKINFNSIIETRKSQNLYSHYHKLPKCNNCAMEKYCLGYYKQYFEQYGENEINPIIL